MQRSLMENPSSMSSFSVFQNVVEVGENAVEKRLKVHYKSSICKQVI